MVSRGEFARLGAVSTRTLRHYDEIGLLHPAKVDPHTGDRSYAAEQFGQLNRIMATVTGRPPPPSAAAGPAASTRPSTTTSRTGATPTASRPQAPAATSGSTRSTTSPRSTSRSSRPNSPSLELPNYL
ncbi:MAG TPA: MerR family DNA-binding transcriptional regulator [Trebonia sp.]|nr:MerR family DNA-binding transcriptional regulator [Trebonia sp.]